MVVLNWNSAFEGITLSPGAALVVPNQFSPLSLWPSPDPPLTVARIGEFGIYFRLDPADPTGNTFLLDADGLKAVYGVAPYRIDDLAANGTFNDHVWVIGYPPGSLVNGASRNALTRSTILLGQGNDRFELVGRGIAQSAEAVVARESARGFMDGSTIDAGPGDDSISVLMPWQSIFRGGANTDYGPNGLNVQLSAANTLAQVPYGDTIELKGSRTDWDLEFRDEDGDGSVTLASILDQRDCILTSNGNRISGFERLRFGTILLDLVLYRQLAAAAVFGQPDYYLFGDALAPELNSTVGADLWEAFLFNRTRLAGIKGAVDAPISVRTGAADDTPFLQDGIANASLFTDGGDDIVYAGAISSAAVETGAGDDQLVVDGAVLGSHLAAGRGRDAFRLGSVAFSDIVMGTEAENDNDTLEIGGSLDNATLWGGGGFDALLIHGFDPAISPLAWVVDEMGGYYRWGTNKFYGFEQVSGAAPAGEPPMAPGVGAEPPAGPGGVAAANPAAENTLYGGLGEARPLVGTDGKDVFTYRAAAGLAAADEIRDFERGTDKILISELEADSPIGKALKGRSSGKVLTRVKQNKQVARSHTVLVYNTKKGELFYNANGKRKGLGDGGGLIADFSPNVKLHHSDFLFSYVDPLA